MSKRIGIKRSPHGNDVSQRRSSVDVRAEVRDRHFTSEVEVVQI